MSTAYLGSGLCKLNDEIPFAAQNTPDGGYIMAGTTFGERPSNTSEVTPPPWGEVGRGLSPAPEG